MPRKALIGPNDMLAWALAGLEREIVQTRDRLTTLNKQAGKLRARLGRPPAAASAGAPAPKKRVMSAAARRRISRAMKQRWAERKRQAQKK